MSEIEVFKNRTNTIRVSLGMDVSSDTFIAEIRTKANHLSELIATWDVRFETDGTDGELILTLDDSDIEGLTFKYGFTDLKRISAGEPLPVFAPVRVVFIDTVTP